MLILSSWGMETLVWGCLLHWGHWWWQWLLSARGSPAWGGRWLALAASEGEAWWGGLSPHSGQVAWTGGSVDLYILALNVVKKVLQHSTRFEGLTIQIVFIYTVCYSDLHCSKVEQFYSVFCDFLLAVFLPDEDDYNKRSTFEQWMSITNPEKPLTTAIMTFRL